MNPRIGPAIPMSKSARRVVIGARIRITAPNVPKGNGDGKKRVTAINSVILAREKVTHLVRQQKIPAASTKTESPAATSADAATEQRNREKTLVRPKTAPRSARTKSQTTRPPQASSAESEKKIIAGHNRPPPRAHPRRRQINNFRRNCGREFPVETRPCAVAGAIAHEGWMPRREKRVPRRSRGGRSARPFRAWEPERSPEALAIPCRA